MKPINFKNIDELYDFNDLHQCKDFLCNLYIKGKRVEHIDLADGARVRMEDIPEDQVIMRANEIRGWVVGEQGLQ